jgi:hypothetical protein
MRAVAIPNRTLARILEERVTSAVVPNGACFFSWIPTFPAFGSGDQKRFTARINEQASPNATLKLIFEGKSFPVPKKYLMELLDPHQELFQATTYAVQSSVPADVFKEFVNSLKAQIKFSDMNRNAASLSLLAMEFLLRGLAAECASFSFPADPPSSILNRVCQMRLHVSFSKPPRQIGDEIERQDANH